MFELKVFIVKLIICVEKEKEKRELVRYILKKCIYRKANGDKFLRFLLTEERIDMIKSNKDYFDKKLYKFTKSYEIDFYSWEILIIL